MRHSAKAWGLLVLLLITPFAASAPKQDGAARSIPVSRDLLWFTASYGTNSPTQFAILNGGMATVSMFPHVKLGLVPVMSGDHVVLTVAEITPIGTGSGSERIQATGQLTLTLGAPVQLPGAPMPFLVSWDRTRPAPQTAPPASQAPCRECCVNCGGVSFCGCVVIAPCGTCCCVDCGGCDVVRKSALGSPPSSLLPELLRRPSI